MLKFVKHHLTNITGIEVYPLISFGIFFVFFVGLLAYVVMERKEYINKMKNMPLDDII
jgi:cytochrome c oxidase cbb3-type subunit 4